MKINELLCFLTFYGDKLDRTSLLSAISGFYTHEEAVAAKQLLIQECDKLGLSNSITEFKKKRLNTTKEDALPKVTKDILDIWEVIDCQRGGVTESVFLAADPSRLPSVEAEKVDVNGLATVVSQPRRSGNTTTRSFSLGIKIHARSTKRIKQRTRKRRTVLQATVGA